MSDTLKTRKKTDFAETVYRVVRTVPKGSTLSYQEVAAAAGSPRAYRRVATILKQNYDPTVPCHRVIRSDGSIGDYNRGGEAAKRALLEAEQAVQSRAL